MIQILIIQQTKVPGMAGSDQYDEDFDFEDDNKANKNSNSPHYNDFSDARKVLNKKETTDNGYEDDFDFEVEKKANKNTKKQEKRKDDEYDNDFESVGGNTPVVRNKSDGKKKKGLNGSNLHKNFSSNKIHQNRESTQLRKRQSQQFYSNKNPSGSFKTMNLRLQVDKKQKRYAKEIPLNSNEDMDRVSKTAQQNRGANRYYAQVIQKTSIMNPTNANIQMLHKYNESLRDMIKRYNDQLSNIINKNLSLFAKNQHIFKNNSKSSKKMRIEEAIRVLREEIRNNEKIEMIGDKQLKTIKQSKKRMDMIQSELGSDSEQQKQEIRTKIKEAKKNIRVLKLKIQNQSKKLVPQDIPIPIPKVSALAQNHAQMGKVKQQVLVAKKQFQKNEEKLNSLEARQSQLNRKIEEILPKDREASHAINNLKISEEKSKKYQQTRKKLQTLRNHREKVRNLWETKSNVISHENFSQKQKLKNLELQIKNVEESINDLYEKAKKMLDESKLPQNKLKLLEQLTEQMKVYEAFSTNKLKKQMTRSRLGKIEERRQSSRNLLHEAANQTSEKTKNKEEKQEQQVSKKQIQKKQVSPVNEKKKEQQSEQRVWKDQKKEKKIEIQDKNKIEGGDKKEDNSIKNEVSKETFKQPDNSQAQEKQQKEENTFVPKRFMLNRKNKQESKSYLPSAENVKEEKEPEIKQSTNQVGDEEKFEQKKTIGRPMFKLNRKNKQIDNKNQNQFMN